MEASFLKSVGTHGRRRHPLHKARWSAACLLILAGTASVGSLTINGSPTAHPLAEVRLRSSNSLLFKLKNGLLPSEELVRSLPEAAMKACRDPLTDDFNLKQDTLSLSNLTGEQRLDLVSVPKTPTDCFLA